MSIRALLIAACCVSGGWLAGAGGTGAREANDEDFRLRDSRLPTSREENDTTIKKKDPQHEESDSENRDDDPNVH